MCTCVPCRPLPPPPYPSSTWRPQGFACLHPHLPPRVPFPHACLWAKAASPRLPPKMSSWACFPARASVEKQKHQPQESCRRLPRSRAGRSRPPACHPAPTSPEMGGRPSDTGSLSESAQATRTEHHKLCGLSNRNAFPPSSGDLKSQIEVPASLVPSQACLCGL